MMDSLQRMALPLRANKNERSNYCCSLALR
jgi:hypothetical protein